MKGFCDAQYELDHCRLNRLSVDEAASIAGQLVKIDPWKTLNTDELRLANHLENHSGKGGAWGVFFRDNLVGVVSIKPDWLVGPYLDFLGIIPEAQGESLGQTILGWMEAQAELSKARNLFLCVSEFNHKAKGFYEKFGFADVGLLEGLIVDEYSEILMRKQLF